MEQKRKFKNQLEKNRYPEINLLGILEEKKNNLVGGYKLGE